MMSGQVTAEIGHWYRPFNSQSMFEVVAIDFDEQTIEIQYYDGEIAELDFTAWKTVIPLEAATPEDWTGPYEIERQDPAFNDYAINEALQQLERQLEQQAV
jgi:hypothetical protein